MKTWTRRAVWIGLIGSGFLYACSTPASQFVAEVEAKYPPIGQFIDVRDPGSGEPLRLHYDKRGAGPAVVLIHGASGNLRDFTFAMSDALAARGFTALAFDRPGLGYSERAGGASYTPSSQAAVMRAATAALGIERPIVVGHSFGGAVAAAWAVDAPAQTRGAVIVSGVTYPWPAGDNAYHAAASTAIFGPPINALVRRRALRTGADGAVNWVFQPQAAPAGYAQYIGAELASRPASFRENGRDITNVNEALEIVSERYGALNIPIELVHGTADKIVPIDAHARRFQAALPAARLTELPGIGHMAHHVAAEAVIAAVQRIAAATPES
jgi:pimeloyl-ACP methyl ester carboxylesterase